MKVKTNMKAGNSSSNPVDCKSICPNAIDNAYREGYGDGYYQAASNYT